jgi:TonB family protein
MNCVLICCTALFPCACSVAGAQQGDANRSNPEIPLAGKDGVSNPTCQHCPFPGYSRKARKKKYQGVVVLSIVVTSEGRVTEIKIIKDPGEGLAEKAAEAVRKWRFKPAMKDGTAVTARVEVEVSFHLY